MFVVETISSIDYCWAFFCWFNALSPFHFTNLVIIRCDGPGFVICLFWRCLRLPEGEFALVFNCSYRFFVQFSLCCQVAQSIFVIIQPIDTLSRLLMKRAAVLILIWIVYIAYMMRDPCCFRPSISVIRSHSTRNGELRFKVIWTDCDYEIWEGLDDVLEERMGLTTYLYRLREVDLRSFFLLVGRYPILSRALY